jgi:hypothetical protein
MEKVLKLDGGVPSSKLKAPPNSCMPGVCICNNFASEMCQFTSGTMSFLLLKS